MSSVMLPGVSTLVVVVVVLPPAVVTVLITLVGLLLPVASIPTPGLLTFSVPSVLGMDVLP